MYVCMCVYLFTHAPPTNNADAHDVPPRPLDASKREPPHRHDSREPLPQPRDPFPRKGGPLLGRGVDDVSYVTSGLPERGDPHSVRGSPLLGSSVDPLGPLGGPPLLGKGSHGCLVCVCAYVCVCVCVCLYLCLCLCV